jgi:hypothetical protein
MTKVMSLRQERCTYLQPQAGQLQTIILLCKSPSLKIWFIHSSQLPPCSAHHSDVARPLRRLFLFWSHHLDLQSKVYQAFSHLKTPDLTAEPRRIVTRVA